ncbi:hypothetical protein L873DRAFT_1251123 [Choiromyces venosus 120613-1]|uniref:Uncharacterized protein n=1 Tax=Choiromyces venosus 120613-1 TaxID=1336337 RepID=A0A3N4JGR2_9PEZI|nr:hypothetical protein L873DRAFT_1251123 [Choiromyces venosus 120613-1]
MVVPARDLGRSLVAGGTSTVPDALPRATQILRIRAGAVNGSIITTSGTGPELRITAEEQEGAGAIARIVGGGKACLPVLLPRLGLLLMRLLSPRRSLLPPREREEGTGGNVPLLEIVWIGERSGLQEVMLRKQVAGVAAATTRRSGPGEMPAHPREGDRRLPTTTTARVTRTVGAHHRAPGTDRRRVPLLLLPPPPPLVLLRRRRRKMRRTRTKSNEKTSYVNSFSGKRSSGLDRTVRVMGVGKEVVLKGRTEPIDSVN